MKNSWLSLILVSSLLASVPAGADEFADKGRAIHKKHQQAVVTVQLVVKSKLTMSGMPGQSSESRQEVTGTIVDASGLTVVSLSAIDPGQMVQNVMGGADRVKMESELSDVKMLLSDGNELPAEVVLRDRDLDIAFIRPKSKPASSMAFLDLTQSGSAQVLDPMVALNRLGNAAGRAYSASAERISAIVQRPRLFYIPDSNMTTSTLGCPAFTLDGKVLGIFVMRATKSTGTGSSPLGGQNPNYTGIVLPAADVLKAAKQAPATGEGQSQGTQE
jgi:S1-C subfamily serine protease